MNSLRSGHHRLISIFQLVISGPYLGWRLISNSARAESRHCPRPFGVKKPSKVDKIIFGLLDEILGCKSTQAGMKFFEFPLTMPVFIRGSRLEQGPDRVIAISPSPGHGKPWSFIYYMAITHRGGKGLINPSFRPFTRVIAQDECSSARSLYGPRKRQQKLLRSMKYLIFLV